MDEIKKDGTGGAAPKPASPLKGKTVLWVEDDKFLSDILVRKFQQIGCDIQRMKNGEEALAFLEQKVPHVILLDILLPGMNGFDILQKVKMNPKLRSIPVVILSNTSQSSDLEKSKVLGANLFLVKAAVSLDQILHEVGSLVK
jgi:CheY-like chemotaxis protein